MISNQINCHISYVLKHQTAVDLFFINNLGYKQ